MFRRTKNSLATATNWWPGYLACSIFTVPTELAQLLTPVAQQLDFICCVIIMTYFKYKSWLCLHYEVSWWNISFIYKRNWVLATPPQSLSKDEDSQSLNHPALGILCYNQTVAVVQSVSQEQYFHTCSVTMILWNLALFIFVVYSSWALNKCCSTVSC